MANLEPAQPELPKQKSGEEIALLKAISSPLIAHSDVEQISQVLRLVMVKIGLRSQNWPSDEEKIVLIAHIVENFGGNRVEEIRLAFDMAIAGKLEFGKDESVVAFENFSCLYFSSVMNAYRKWSSQAYKTLPTEQPKEQRIFTDEEIEDSQREDAERQYQLFIRGYGVIGAEINKFILKKDGFLNDGDDVIEFFKKRIATGKLNIYVRQ